ncbi:MAG: hypothetical protein NT141_01825 [candidate division WWE3 bacterium]|nr:hypothetical protein [candidate division WWE3 bacterium]
MVRSEISEEVVEVTAVDDTKMVDFCEGIWETAFPTPPAEAQTHNIEELAQRVHDGFNPVDAALDIAFPATDTLYDDSEHLF